MCVYVCVCVCVFVFVYSAETPKEATPSRPLGPPACAGGTAYWRGGGGESIVVSQYGA
jgi:hypothetical protein